MAADLVAHFEKRVEAMDGKAMVVCMSRRICVDLYNALIKLRPEWEAETLKVVMTGSAEDGPEWQKHIGNKKQRRDLANQLTHPPPHGGFALRAAYWQSVSPPASRLGSRTRSTPSRS